MCYACFRSDSFHAHSTRSLSEEEWSSTIDLSPSTVKSLGYKHAYACTHHTHRYVGFPYVHNQYDAITHCHNMKTTFSRQCTTVMILWRNGSVSDSRSEGCMFESCRDHKLFSPLAISCKSMNIHVFGFRPTTLNYVGAMEGLTTLEKSSSFPTLHEVSRCNTAVYTNFLVLGIATCNS